MIPYTIPEGDSDLWDCGINEGLRPVQHWRRSLLPRPGTLFEEGPLFPDFTPERARVLVSVAAGMTSRKDIGDKFGITSTAISQQLNRLACDGFVEFDEKSKPRTTARGRRALEHAAEIWRTAPPSPSQYTVQQWWSRRANPDDVR